MLVRLPLKAKQDEYHHHADAQSEGSPHHGLAAADAVDEDGGEETADDEHDLDAAADDLGEVFAEADVGVEDGRDEVDDEVDSADLVHELHSIGQETRVISII